MSKINVILLNFHGVTSHVEILLEDLSAKTKTYYTINRWSPPDNAFTELDEVEDYISLASSVYRFKIEADPEEIAAEWNTYYHATRPKAHLLGFNCADAAQWFLSRFADIPEPHFYNTPITVNHLAMGLVWPSFLPFGTTLPGRIMSNAKFHVDARNNPLAAKRYSYLYLNVCIAASALGIAVGIAGITLASLYLAGALSVGIIMGGALLGAISSYSFIAHVNAKATKQIATKFSKVDESKPLLKNKQPSRPPGKPNIHGFHTISSSKSNTAPAAQAFQPFQGVGRKLGTT